MRGIVGYILTIFSGVPASFTRSEEKLPPIGWPARGALTVVVIGGIAVWVLFVFVAPQQ